MAKKNVFKYIHARKLMEDIASECDGKIRADYSGRNMYGRVTWGIVTELPISAIEAAASRGLRGASMDSMGLSTIVYWPEPEVDNLCDEYDSEEEYEDEEIEDEE